MTHWTLARTSVSILVAAVAGCTADIVLDPLPGPAQEPGPSVDLEEEASPEIGEPAVGPTGDKEFPAPEEEPTPIVDNGGGGEPIVEDPVVEEPPTDTPVPGDGRRIVTGAVATSPSTLRLSLAGQLNATPLDGDSLSVSTDRGGAGFGDCGAQPWVQNDEVMLANLHPGQTYTVQIHYADQTSAPPVTVTMPALGAPEARAPEVGEVGAEPGCGLVYVDAADDTRVGLLEFFFNGQLIASIDYADPNMVAIRQVAAQAGDLTWLRLYGFNVPDELSGQAGLLHAVVHDVFGNATATPAVPATL